MSQKMTRRRFGRLAVLGTIGAGTVTYAHKTLGQTGGFVVVGISLGAPRTGNIPTNLERTEIDLDDTANPVTTAVATDLLVQSLDISSGRPQNLDTRQVLKDGTTPLMESGEQLSGLASLAQANSGFPKGTLIAAVTPLNTGARANNSTRLVVLGSTPTAITVSGLNKQEKLTSIVGARDGTLKGLVVKKNGKAPVTLVDVNLQTGAITALMKLNLPGKEMLVTLADCPDGKLYTVAVGDKGDTNLVQIEVGQKKLTVLAQLRTQEQVWNNGLQNLLCSPAGEFLALGGLRYEPFSIYRLNPVTGLMAQPVPFDVAQVTLRSV